MASTESAAGADTTTPSARAEHKTTTSIRMTLLAALPAVTRCLAIDNGLLDLVMARSILLLLVLGLEAGVGCLGGLLWLWLWLGLGRHLTQTFGALTFGKLRGRRALLVRS